MRQLMSRVALATLVAPLIALSGCASSTQAAHPTDGVWGYVAAARSAQLEITSDATTSELEVDRVLAPGAAWVVVHTNDNGKPGKRVGLAHVAKGESTGVKVALKNVTSDSLIVAVHADKGTAGEFDFSMDDPTGSPDRPYFVGGKELAEVVDVR